MKLPAQRAIALLEIGRVDLQFAGKTEEAEEVAGPDVDIHAPKELPQPQVDFAFGLLNTKPLLIMLVS